jgi:ABC-type sugar transport system substrate-binding protein
VRFAAACVLLLGGALACTPSNTTVLPKRNKGGLIALVGAGRDVPEWRIFQATAERYSAGLEGFALTTGAPDRATPNAQIALLRQLESAQLRGVIIHPADTAIMPAILDDLRQRGVIVVTLMRRLENTNPFLYAGVDEVEAGRLLVDSLSDALGGKGNVVVLQSPSAKYLSDRTLGVQQRLAQLPSINVLRDIDTTDNAFVAERLLREYVERFPRLDGCIALDDWPLRNLAPEQHLLPSTCRMVTFGAYPQLWGRLDDGTCAALVGAPYDKIVEAALRMCVTAALGQPVEAQVYLAEPLLVTPENLTQFRATWFAWRERPADMRGRP